MSTYFHISICRNIDKKVYACIQKINYITNTFSYLKLTIPQNIKMIIALQAQYSQRGFNSETK